MEPEWNHGVRRKLSARAAGPARPARDSKSVARSARARAAGARWPAWDNATAAGSGAGICQRAVAPAVRVMGPGPGVGGR